MNSWQKRVLEKLLPQRFSILRWVMILVLVLSLTSCGEKADSQEVSTGYKENSPKISQISKQFSEVSPPSVIQELRPILEVYQPQVTIVTPKFDEVLQDNKVTASFQVKDLPIFKDPQLQLGPHLHVILDNQPYIPVYDLNQPLVLPDLSPGSHTLRVFASRPWHESFKNEGAYAQTTFYVFTKTDDNTPDPKFPLLTYSRPQSSYGAEPILLDFYLTNAPLHLVGKENPNDEFSDWRIRSTINGESFIFDRWQAVYLKGFRAGKNWVKLEFLDNQGNAVKNAFNTTVRLIDYQPKGKDTLSRIVRGELTAAEVRGIVDPNYKLAPKPIPTPSVEKTPQIQPKVEKQPIPETEVPEKSQIQPEQPKLEVPTAVPSPTLSPTPPEIITPAPEAQPEITPTPESTPLPEKVTPQPTKPRFGGFFNRGAGKVPTPEAPVAPSPSLPPTLPEIIESPVPEIITPTPEPQPEVTPTPESTPLPKKVTPQPTKSRFGGFFNRLTSKTPTPQVTIAPSPSSSPTLPEIIESPVPKIITPPAEPEPEVTPNSESMPLSKTTAPDPEKPELTKNTQL
ncbi:hypothetical protein CDG76_12930 [Nostoc sp. 'Peltigera membranacea cyanobiont' 210A]|uniref:hypothetical protein n=1 Tax=Nostoc sp. 'Peltigera membranacea cyanobiont' 210A TaxID=2014529 RepID=UPI000B954703|nr:hypothetical protein [Nostoc sp. 'Peltigera membranacea cyanobiont' 210A]OYD94915.1 hypothetical protein CDG76_12930 [Nostoc sp. 'Peltigera membranacea cyanobiont' 210A]